MIENTNTKQFYPGPILNTTLEITDFLFNDAEQIKVKHSKFNEENILVDVDLNYGTDYEVTKVLPSDINVAEAALTASTGQVIIKNINVLDGEKLTVYRLSELIQDKDYPRAGAFPAATHEGALDYLTMQNQEQQEELSRTLKVPISTGEFSAVVPVPLPNRILRIDENATGFEFVPYDLDERLDTFEDTIENTLETNKSELETNFNNFKLETEELIEDNKQEVLSIQSDYQREMDSKFQTVSDAADKINILDESIQLCKDSAETASEQAEIATNKANEILNVKDELETEIDTKANVDLSNLSEIGEKHFLGKSQITNCITEIPQRIKTTLVGTALTLHKGSEFIKPNGFEEDGTTLKFDYIVTENDINGTANTSSVYLFNINPTLDNIGGCITIGWFVSATQPSTTTHGHFWYDTTNNIVKRYLNGAWDNGGWSLPFCEIASGLITQVFNGMGYIGADLVWIDKGVTAICGQGTNADGTIKNATYKHSKIEFIDLSGWNALTASASGYLIHIVTSKRNHAIFQPDYRFYSSLADPTDTNSLTYSYIEKEKQWYVWDGSTSNLFWEKAQVYIYADITTKGGAFNPREVFRCLNKHEVVSKYGDTMTGTLKVQYPSASNYDYRSATAPSTTIYAGAYEIADKNGKVVARLFNCLNNWNNVVTQLSTVRNIDGSDKSASALLYIDTNGVDRFQFPMCTTKATTNSTAANSKVAVVVQNYVNGNAWMRKWSDGWIEQGAKTTLRMNETKMVNFVTGFSNTNYSVFANFNAAINTDDNPIPRPHSTTQFALYGTEMGAYSSDWGPQVVAWYACGY